MLRWNKFQLKLLQDYDVHSSLWQARRFLTTAVFAMFQHSEVGGGVGQELFSQEEERNSEKI